MKKVYKNYGERKILAGFDYTFKRKERIGIIGVNGNRSFYVKYGPDAFIDFVNKPMTKIPSLYYYQLKKRLK